MRLDYGHVPRTAVVLHYSQVLMKYECSLLIHGYNTYGSLQLPFTYMYTYVLSIGSEV